MTPQAKWEPYDPAYAEREERITQSGDAGEQNPTLRQIQEATLKKPKKKLRFRVETVEDEKLAMDEGIEEVLFETYETIVNEAVIENDMAERYIYEVPEDMEPQRAVFHDK
jgi:hypothetical protein